MQSMLLFAIAAGMIPSPFNGPPRQMPPKMVRPPVGIVLRVPSGEVPRDVSGDPRPTPVRRD